MISKLLLDFGDKQSHFLRYMYRSPALFGLKKLLEIRCTSGKLGFKLWTYRVIVIDKVIRLGNQQITVKIQK